MKNIHMYYSLSRSECLNDKDDHKDRLYSIICCGNNIENEHKMSEIYIGNNEYTTTMNVSVWFEI